MQVESTSKPMLTVDEVEQIKRKNVATIIGHVFQLTYGALFDKLVQGEKLIDAMAALFNIPVKDSTLACRDVGCRRRVVLLS